MDPKQTQPTVFDCYFRRSKNTDNFKMLNHSGKETKVKDIVITRKLYLSSLIIIERRSREQNIKGKYNTALKYMGFGVNRYSQFTVCSYINKAVLRMLHKM